MRQALRKEGGPGMVAQTYNPSTLELETGGLL